MGVSNVGFVLASWTCLCSGFTVVSTSTREASWHGGDLFGGTSGASCSAGGAVVSLSGRTRAAWRAGRYSLPPHRRRTYSARGARRGVGSTTRAASGGGGGAEKGDNAEETSGGRGVTAEAERATRTSGLGSGSGSGSASGRLNGVQPKSNQAGLSGEEPAEAEAGKGAKVSAAEAAAAAAAASVVAALGSPPGAPVAVSNGKASADKKRLMAQMVKAAGQRQHWKEAIVLFDQMQEKGVPTVKAAYGAALRACAKGADWERGTQLLDNYLEEGYELDVAIVSNAVKACCRAGRPSEAEAILAKSLDRGLVPEVSLFTAVMNACYTVGDMDAILSLGDQLRNHGLTPDHAAYHLIVTSHISKLDWVSATEALVEMGEAGLAPTAGSARKWRLANAAIEEIDIEMNEDYAPREQEDEEEDEVDDEGDDGRSTRDNSDFVY